MFTGLTFFIVTAIPMLQARILDEDMLLYWRRSDSGECKPFTTYMISCNKCICSAEGIPYCTRMTCFNKMMTNRLDQIKATLPNEQEDSSIEGD